MIILKKLEWDNLFNYGESNSIDFSTNHSYLSEFFVGDIPIWHPYPFFLLNSDEITEASTFFVDMFVI